MIRRVPLLLATLVMGCASTPAVAQTVQHTTVGVRARIVETITPPARVSASAVTLDSGEIEVVVSVADAPDGYPSGLAVAMNDANPSGHEPDLAAARDPVRASHCRLRSAPAQDHEVDAEPAEIAEAGERRYRLILREGSAGGDAALLIQCIVAPPI